MSWNAAWLKKTEGIFGSEWIVESEGMFIHHGGVITHNMSYDFLL